MISGVYCPIQRVKMRGEEMQRAMLSDFYHTVFPINYCLLSCFFSVFYFLDVCVCTTGACWWAWTAVCWSMRCGLWADLSQSTSSLRWTWAWCWLWPRTSSRRSTLNSSLTWPEPSHTKTDTSRRWHTHTNTHVLLKTKHCCSRNTQRHKQADSVTTRHQSCSQWPHIWEQQLVPAVWEWFIGTRWTLKTSNAPQALQARGHTHTWSVSVFLLAWQLPSLFVHKIAKLMHIRYMEPAIYV